MFLYGVSACVTSASVNPNVCLAFNLIPCICGAGSGTAVNACLSPLSLVRTRDNFWKTSVNAVLKVVGFLCMGTPVSSYRECLKGWNLAINPKVSYCYLLISCTQMHASPFDIFSLFTTAILTALHVSGPNEHVFISVQSAICQVIVVN